MTGLPEHLSAAPVGRKRLSREELTRLQRERVLVAATGVFAKRGYQATTIDNIALASKASVGGIYQLFEGKEDCFLGVYDRIVLSAKEQIAEQVAGANSWAEQALAGLGAVLEFILAEPLAGRIVLIEAPTAGPVATARYNELIDATTRWLRSGREQYPDSADLPGSFELAAVGGLAFYLQQQLLASESRSVSALLGDTAPMVLEPIMGAAEFNRRLGDYTAAKPA